MFFLTIGLIFNNITHIYEDIFACAEDITWSKIQVSKINFEQERM